MRNLNRAGDTADETSSFPSQIQHLITASPSKQQIFFRSGAAACGWHSNITLPAWILEGKGAASSVAARCARPGAFFTSFITSTAHFVNPHALQHAVQTSEHLQLCCRAVLSLGQGFGLPVPQFLPLQDGIISIIKHVKKKRNLPNSTPTWPAYSANVPNSQVFPLSCSKQLTDSKKKPPPASPRRLSSPSKPCLPNPKQKSQEPVRTHGTESNGALLQRQLPVTNAISIQLAGQQTPIRLQTSWQPLSSSGGVEALGDKACSRNRAEQPRCALPLKQLKGSPRPK